MANASGLIANTQEQTITGLEMYIDTDTSPSGTISGETLIMNAEFATLMAGKGVKVKVNEKLKSFGLQMQFKFHEITGTAINVLYGGDISTITSPFSGKMVSFKGKMTSPVPKKFTFKGLTGAGKEIQIVFYNAINTEYGNIALDGQDFAALPVTLTPIPIVPGDETETMVDVMIEDVGT